MLSFLFSLFSHLCSQYRLLAFGLTILAVLAIVFFSQEPLVAKLAVFGIMAVIVWYLVWKLLRQER